MAARRRDAAGHLIEPARSAWVAPRHRVCAATGCTAAESRWPDPQREANSSDTTATTHDNATDHDHDNPAARSRVTRVDASTRLSEHDQNADTLLGVASDTEARVISAPGSQSRNGPHRASCADALGAPARALDRSRVREGQQARRRPR
jgi:hypothetical protein